MNTPFRCALQALVVCLLFFTQNGYGQVDGTLDLSFNPQFNLYSDAKAIALQANGNIITYGGPNPSAMVRITGNGSLDPTFYRPARGLNRQANAIILQQDGKMVIGGDFYLFNDTICNYIVRLNANGRQDFSFTSPSLGFSNSVSSLALQQDGKIIAGGRFQDFDGINRNRIARLHANGTLDTGFDPSVGFDSYVKCLALQPDGKILVGGYFSHYAGVARGGIARLNSDASLDTSFHPGATFQYSVKCLALQPDGKILLGGICPIGTGLLCNPIVRLNADGAPDTAFNARPHLMDSVGSYGAINSLALQHNGFILAGGDFAFSNGAGQKGILRLKPDGSIDTTFKPGTGANHEIQSITIQTDGKVIIGGSFTTYNGVNRNYIARLNNSSAVATKEVAAQTFTLSPNPTHQTVTVTSTQPLKTIRIISTAGQAVLTQSCGEDKASLDVSALSPGLYLVEAETESGVVRKRLVVE